MERLEPKAPSEVRNYTFDWSAFLGTDTIATSAVVVSGVTLDSSSHDTNSVTVRVSAGTAGTVAEITNTITTVGGFTETELFLLPVTTTAEPVSLAEAKAHLNIVDDDSQDALISSYISAARAYVESESGFVFVRRQFVESLSWWPTYLSLGRRPLISVDSIDYTDEAGAAQTVDPADYYTALATRRVTPVAAWPTLGNGGAISVRYTAGFDVAEQAEELDLARQAILLLVGHWYANRETVVVGSIAATEIPFAARATIDRFRAQVV